MKRILAILTIVVLLGLYVWSFVAALTASPNAARMFFAAVFATVFLPIIVFFYLQMAEVKNQAKKEKQEKEKSSQEKEEE